MIRRRFGLLRPGRLAPLWLSAIITLIALPAYGPPAVTAARAWAPRPPVARRGRLLAARTARLQLHLLPARREPAHAMPPSPNSRTWRTPRARRLPALARLAPQGAVIVARDRRAKRPRNRGIAPAAPPLVAYPLMSNTQENQNLAPPDTQIGVGDGFIVEMVNDTISIWGANGSFVGQTDLNVFYPVPGGYLFGDPQVLYDAISGRWFASGFSFDANGGSQTYLAVSASSDPRASWHIYTLASYVGVEISEPSLGVSSDAVTLSWNDYASGSFSGQETWVMDKAVAMTGAGIPYFAFSPDATRFHVVPERMSDGTATPELVYTGQDGFGNWYLGVVTLTGDPATGPMTWNEADVTISTLTPPPTATQPNGGPPLDTSDYRVLSAAWQNGVLWAALDDGCVPAADTTLHSCLRLIQVSLSGGVATLLQDFDAGDLNTDLFYPAVTMDGAGNLFVVYSASSATQYASVGVTGQMTTWAPNVIAPYQTLQPGSGIFDCGCQSSNGGDRWGDYSAAVPDPNDATVVWLAGEYAASSSDPNDWGTAAGQLIFSTPVPTNTPSPLPTNTSAGTATQTPTAPPTNTSTGTATNTPTATSTSAAMATPTVTASSTGTPASTATVTATPATAVAGTPSPLPSAAASATTAPTLAPTALATQTDTPAPTATPTASATPPTATASPTPMSTAPAPSSTPIASATFTPAATATATASSAPPPSPTRPAPPSATVATSPPPPATSTPRSAPPPTATPPVSGSGGSGAGTEAPPSATATATAVPSSGHGSHQTHGRHPPHHPAHHPALTLRVTPRRVRSGAMVLLRAQAAAGTQLVATLQVTQQRITWTGSGRHRRRHVRLVVLYSVDVKGRVGRRGTITWQVRVRYAPRRPTAALVRVSIAAHQRVRAVTVQMPITVLPALPPRTHHHTTPAGSQHSHTATKRK